MFPMIRVTSNLNALLATQHVGYLHSGFVMYQNVELRRSAASEQMSGLTVCRTPVGTLGLFGFPHMDSPTDRTL
jgi:hypothetical protein